MRRLWWIPFIPLPIPLLLAVLAVGLVPIVIAEWLGSWVASLAIALAACLGYMEVLRRYGRRHRQRLRRTPPRLDAAWRNATKVAVPFALLIFTPIPVGIWAFVTFVAEVEIEERLERGLLRWDGSRGSPRPDRPTP